MQRLALTIGTVAASVLLSLSMSSSAQAHELEPICQEDMICWDGRTMGNRQTGEWDEQSETYLLTVWLADGTRSN